MGVDRIFVTVEGPTRSVDVALPNGRPVGELIPTLVEMIEGSARPDDDEWTLASPGGRLEPDVTLGRAHIADGSILVLQRAPLGDDQALAAPETPAAEEDKPPAAGLPARPGLAERLRNVADAVRSTEPEPAPELATARRSTAVERALRAWEASDYRRRLDEVIATPRLKRCVTIAVVSPKGGVGKTTSTVLLGTLLAMVRNDRVVAVDYDPDYGTLGRTVAGSDAVRVDELVQVLEQPALTVSMLDRCLGRAAHGMMVLPAPEDPERIDRLEVDAYVRVIKRLQQLAGILVLDCGAGVRNPFARAAMDAADQLILVTDGSPTTAAVVASVAQTLPAARDYVVVVNRALDSHERLDLAQLRATLPDASGLVEIEHEPAAAGRLERGRFTWAAAPASWQVAARRLAATLVNRWEDLGLAG